jgi:hypothetical protein
MGIIDASVLVYFSCAGGIAVGYVTSGGAPDDLSIFSGGSLLSEALCKI